MCLLTFMHEGVTADTDLLACGAENNPDGFGFAIHAGSRIIHSSGLNFEKVLDDFLYYRAIHSGPALFHSRITTHGGTTRDNCHPFVVGRDTSTVLAHNGMLPIAEQQGKSDTRIFAETMFPAWGGAPTLNSRKMRKKLSKFAEGSKLVFITANPAVDADFVIINEHLGSWDKGVWWSNNSHKYSRYSYSGGGMYTTGWSRADESGLGWKENNGLVEDCTYVDAEGNEIWGELWTCSICRHTEYIDEDSVDDATNCPACDSCWYCTESRLLCDCWYTDESPNKQDTRDFFRRLHEDDDLHLDRALSVRNHDSVVDYF